MLKNLFNRKKKDNHYTRFQIYLMAIEKLFKIIVGKLKGYKDKLIFKWRTRNSELIKNLHNQVIELEKDLKYYQGELTVLKSYNERDLVRVVLNSVKSVDGTYIENYEFYKSAVSIGESKLFNIVIDEIIKEQTEQILKVNPIGTLSKVDCDNIARGTINGALLVKERIERFSAMALNDLINNKVEEDID
jgi:hypothetical protein